MLPILHLGPLAIQTPGLVILIGVWLGLWLVEKQASIYKIDSGTLSNLVFFGLVAGVLGARIAYIIHYSFAFQSNLTSVFSLNLSLFDPGWGILVGILVATLYAWRKSLPLRSSLDALAGGLAIFTCFYYLSQLASGDGYGTSSSLPWAIELWGIYRHPVQIYEMLAAAGILWIVWPRSTWYNVPGQRFVAFIALTAGATLFLDAFRVESVLWGGFRSTQVIAWLVLAISLWIAGKFKKGKIDV